MHDEKKLIETLKKKKKEKNVRAAVSSFRV